MSDASFSPEDRRHLFGEPVIMRSKSGWYCRNKNGQWYGPTSRKDAWTTAERIWNKLEAERAEAELDRMWTEEMEKPES